MPRDSEYLPDDEAASRRDEVIRRMANTPPQPKTATRPQGKKTKADGVRSDDKSRARRER